MSDIGREIDRVKRAKAERAFDEGVAAYGSVEARLQSLDCTSREEAIAMLAAVQAVSIYKSNERVVIL